MSTNPVVPLLDLKPQYQSIKQEIDEAVARVIASQIFILGPEVEAFEKEIAEYCSVKHAIGCTSGSDAIVLALMAIGGKPGEEVLCPSYTFFATGGAVARIGMKPVWVDIDPVTYNMCPALTAEAAKSCKKLKAIMPVHLYGQSADMDAFYTLGTRLGTAVIEDAAQAIGSRDAQGAPVGTRGAIATWSFFPSKNLGGFGDAGMCTTDCPHLADSMKMLRVHGSRVKYIHKSVGMNGRLDALQAAVLRVKLRHLETWHAGRQRNATFYDGAFAAAGASDSRTPLSVQGKSGFAMRFPYKIPAPARHIYNQYIIRVPQGMRDDLRAHLTEQKIGTEIYYPVPLHLQECFEYLGTKPGTLPHTEAASLETIALPIFPDLTQDQLRHVAEQVVKYVTANAKSSIGV
jgi:dTDP-4-amino-4,6-dideoxygalactose transaminase